MTVCGLVQSRNTCLQLWGDVRYQEIVNVMCLFSHVRSRSKHTKNFSLNFKMLMSRMWQKRKLAFELKTEQLIESNNAGQSLLFALRISFLKV